MVIKTDSRGLVQWKKTLGGREDDYLWSVLEAADGGIVAAGQTESAGAGDFDAWLVKLEPCENEPPDPPAAPQGMAEARAGEEQAYVCVADVAGDDLVYVRYDWGDGSATGWDGPYFDGDECSASHAWNKPQRYGVRVQFRDIHGGESEWSEALTVTVR